MSYFQTELTLRTFNPLCRLSNRLVQKILDFQEQHNTFVFHEILFPSLAIKNNYSIFCSKKVRASDSTDHQTKKFPCGDFFIAMIN